LKQPPRRWLSALAGSAAAVALALALVHLTGVGRGSAPAQANFELPALPPPAEPALQIPKPRGLRHAQGESRWAPVLRTVAARRNASVESTAVVALATRTPEGTSNIVLVLGSRDDARGRTWVHVRLAVLPNNRTGWVLRATLGAYSFVATRLVVDTEALTATLYRSGNTVFRAPVGVGTRAAPTPRGDFYIRNKLTSYASPVYGPVAFGTSARSAILTDWPAGGFIGIHGTNEPELVPGRVSHGCIRMRNDDILRLARLMPVGTPLAIR
jgi:L,D-transpeptidase catalytic domain